MLGNVWLIALSISSILYQSNSVTGSCSLGEDCQLHSWLPWHACIGNCASQTQLRQREFCCTKRVSPKTIDNCFAACSLPVVELNEYKPCHFCYNGTLSKNSSCKCDYGYKGRCCKGLFLMFWIKHEICVSKELKKTIGFNEFYYSF